MNFFLHEVKFVVMDCQQEIRKKTRKQTN